MITLYADLVEFGFRVLENPQLGEIAVPSFLREQVRQELIRRGFIAEPV